MIYFLDDRVEIFFKYTCLIERKACLDTNTPPLSLSFIILLYFRLHSIAAKFLIYHLKTRLAVLSCEVSQLLHHKWIIHNKLIFMCSLWHPVQEIREGLLGRMVK